MKILLGLVPDGKRVLRAEQALTAADIGENAIRTGPLFLYVQGVRRGAALLVVEAPDDEVSEVIRILRQESGLLVHSIEGVATGES